MRVKLNFRGEIEFDGRVGFGHPDSTALTQRKFEMPFAANNPFFPNQAFGWFVGFCLTAFCFAAICSGQIDGFTEPFRQIELSSDETGAIAELAVVEGEAVDQGQVIARLDSRVQGLQVEIAQQMLESVGELNAAKRMLQQRKSILERVQELRKTGHATEGELIRANMEWSIAEGKFLAAKEDQLVREIELRRAMVQLERRTIRAPFTGVVAKIHRREGEFLSPLHPEVLTLVKVDQLIATFAIPSSQISQFRKGEKFNVEMNDGKTVQATVYRVGVQTDAKSGTVVVKFLIENPGQEFRSGEHCSLNI